MQIISNANYTRWIFTGMSYPMHHLKKAAGTQVACVSFMAIRSPGSFYINLTTGAYKCFSCGEAGGDVIAFTMAVYGLQFVEALAKLADDWGLL